MTFLGGASDPPPQAEGHVTKPPAKEPLGAAAAPERSCAAATGRCRSGPASAGEEGAVERGTAARALREHRPTAAAFLSCHSLVRAATRFLRTSGSEPRTHTREIPQKPPGRNPTDRSSAETELAQRSPGGAGVRGLPRRQSRREVVPALPLKGVRQHTQPSAGTSPCFLLPRKTHHQLSRPVSPGGRGRLGHALPRPFLRRGPLRRQPLHHHGQDTRAGRQPARRSPATRQGRPQAQLAASAQPEAQELPRAPDGCAATGSGTWDTR